MNGSILALSKSDLHQSVLSHVSVGKHSPEVAPSVTREEKSGSALTCQVCGIGVVSGERGFVDVHEQRAHFKLDWHRYNVHRSLKQRPAVTREQFEQTVENEDVSSISGSESDEEDGRSSQNTKTDDKGLACFTAGDGKMFGVWRCLLVSQKSAKDEGEDSKLLSAFRNLSEMQNWAVILAKGGHFAAACFERVKPPNPKSKGPLYKVKQHKTLHRYVIRAKAGGRQSTKDATGKHARSAGASLRRYNEAALEWEIAEILTSWKAALSECDLIFTCISTSDTKAVFGGAHPPLNQQDPRIRKVPFATRRPTFSESKRVCHVLMSTFDVPQDTPETPQPQKLDEQPEIVKTQIPDPKETEETKQCPSQHEERSEETVDNALPRATKKKSKRKPKGKDQRRRAAMQSAETDTPDPESTQAPDPDDEVERAIAAAAQHIQRTQHGKKSQPTRKKSDSKSPNNIEDRRELMRKAAEQRIANLQAAAKNQQLY